MHSNHPSHSDDQVVGQPRTHQKSTDQDCENVATPGLTGFDQLYDRAVSHASELGPLTVPQYPSRGTQPDVVVPIQGADELVFRNLSRRGVHLTSVHDLACVAFTTYRVTVLDAVPQTVIVAIPTFAIGHELVHPVSAIQPYIESLLYQNPIFKATIDIDVAKRTVMERVEGVIDDVATALAGGFSLKKLVPLATKFVLGGSSGLSRTTNPLQGINVAFEFADITFSDPDSEVASRYHGNPMVTHRLQRRVVLPFVTVDPSSFMSHPKVMSTLTNFMVHGNGENASPLDGGSSGHTRAEGRMPW